MPLSPPTATSGSSPDPAFGLWADPRVALGLAASWFALTLVFFWLPQVDQTVSGLFFTVQACSSGQAHAICGAFALSSAPAWQTLRQVLQDIPIVVAGLLVVVLLGDLAAGRRWKTARVRFVSVALAALAIGPGLVVNVILKDHWGRPRPQMADLFGGHLSFIPAGQWSDLCHANCSFVSGESSSACWLVCLAPLLPAPLRLPTTAVALAVAIATGILRMAFGAHYLSDVVLGGLSTFVVFSALSWLVERRFDRKSAPSGMRQD